MHFAHIKDTTRSAMALLLLMAVAASGHLSSFHTNHLMNEVASPTRDESLVVISHDVRPGYAVVKFPHHEHRHSSYRLLDTGHSQFFAIMPDGLLMTTSEVSSLRGRPVTLIVVEETEPEENNEANVELRSSQRHIVRVHVLDARRRLHFPHDAVDTGYVEENAPVGTVVMGLPVDTLRPRSLRRPSSSHIRLSIEGGNEDGAFMLEQTEENFPRLVTARPLDRERKDEYWLTIHAMDDLLDPLDDAAATKIRVRITDINDNAPRFPKRPYHFKVPRNATRYVQAMFF
jgi:hypothetical protein